MSGVAEVLRTRGISGAAELNVAETVGRLTGETDPNVLAAVALAVLAVRRGHVCLDLTRAREVGVVGDDERPLALVLPEPVAWAQTLVTSPAIRAPHEDGDAPLVLDGHLLYLDRYWRHEQRLVDGLRGLAAGVLDPPADAAGWIDSLFPSDEPGATARRAAARAVLARRLLVLTGGPGTGKTTTVVRLLALLARSGIPPGHVALTAPTGRAAARMAQAVHEQADALPVPDDVRRGLTETSATTLHRLLGWRASTPTRFRHHAGRPLTAEVVIVDEASMVSLPMMARLVEALPVRGRLVLVGDPEQLASVDAGAVLGDVTAAGHDATSAGARLEGAAEGDAAPVVDAAGGDAAPVVVTLREVFRFESGGGIDELAAAIRAADVDPGRVHGLLASGLDGVRHVEPASTPLGMPDEVRELAVAAMRDVAAAARAGDPAETLARQERFRLLAPLRRGPYGVVRANELFARWVHGTPLDRDPADGWPVGTPVMVVRNDHRLGLYNGDVGVVVAAEDHRTQVAFPAPTTTEAVRLVPIARLPAVEPVWAMSVHKSQGSQADEVVVVLPGEDTPLLTRELLYTAVTRARRRVTLVARPDVLDAALGRSVQRASGLRSRLRASSR
jgi:exodeoxyribonuclease V alpha subunit